MLELRERTRSAQKGAKLIKANLLTDPGMYRTMPRKEQWRKIQYRGADKITELRESTASMATDRTNKTPELLGIGKSQMQAMVKAMAISEVIREARKALSRIARDKETLGMARIKLPPERLAWWYVDGGPAGTAKTMSQKRT